MRPSYFGGCAGVEVRGPSARAGSSRAVALATLLASSLAFADPPADPVAAADDLTTLAPDEPGVSVRLLPGQRALFEGRLLSLDENRRRAKKLVALEAELASAKESTWMSTPVLVGLIVGSAVLGAAAGVGVSAWAMKR